MPNNMGEISAYDVDKSGAYRPILRSVGLTPMDVNYKLKSIQMKFTKASDRKFVYLRMNLLPMDYMRVSYKNELVKRNQYNTAKICTMRNAMPRLRAIYHDLPKDLLSAIVLFGFKMMKRFYQIGISVRFNKLRGFINSGSRKCFTGVMTSRLVYARNTKRAMSRQLKFTAISFNKRIRRREYHGYHYCALSEYEHYHLSTHLIGKELTRYMDEAMTNPYKYPYIIAVKMENNLSGKIIKRLKTKITYERGNIEYLWKWDGTRFRATNNSKFRINLLSKWDHNYV